MSAINKSIEDLSSEQRELLELLLKEEGLDATALPILPQGRESAMFPLSFAQQRLWFLHQLEPDNVAYNVAFAVRLKGALDIRALEESLSEVSRRHEALRTTFVVVEGNPWQVVGDPEPMRLPVEDVSALPVEEREKEILRLAEAEGRTPFDLARGPLLRAKLVRAGAEEHVALLMMHHIASDAWSMGVFLHELSTLYNASASGRPAPLAELPIQYVDFAVWQRQRLQGEALDEHLDYWRKQLADITPMLSLPMDKPRPPANTYRGANVPLKLRRELHEGLKELSRQEGVTSFMTLLAAYKTLLHRYSGQRDIVVGTPIANRNRAEIENLIGFFANTLVLRTDLGGEPSFRELLARVRDVTVGAYEHQDLPFETLVDALQPERDLSRNPLFQVWFALEVAPGEAYRLTGLTMSNLAVEDTTAKFDLTLTLALVEGELSGQFNYNVDLFEETTIRRLAAQFERLIEEIVANVERKITRLALLSETEVERIVEEWNETEVEYDRDASLHGLFEAQAKKTPRAIALAFENQTLTYRALNERVNQLARHLQKQGAGPGALVGICVERSLEMVVGLLGILKAGAAYVPLDPHYPKERLAYVLTDARISALLTQRNLAERLPAHEAVIYLDEDWGTIAGESPEDLETGVTAASLAYVIYTSGSTGNPKGVMISHQAAVNFCHAMDGQIGCDGRDTILAITSISFDISVLELFWTLARGAKVVIITEQALVESSAPTRRPKASKTIGYSLFYFASNDAEASDDSYRLLLEGAKFGDRHGFTAVWTPERHFHRFGGLFPNPSVMSAALAMVTEQIQLRAGSVVLPLHSPIRVAEEWALVDNLSKGRVAIAFASGWHADDFAFFPENYPARRDVMFAGIETIKRLWSGGTVMARGGAGNEIPIVIYPKPRQPELPIWITAAGAPDTFVKAGEMGANVLTHLLGQSVEEVAERIKLYRDGRASGGRAPESGCVTLMLHTFIGEDREVVKEQVRQPFINYLRSSVSLVLNLVKSLDLPYNVNALSAKDMDDLLDFAFNRYFETSALFGTPETCRGMIEQLKEIGVDEVACLVDFGVDTDSALGALPHLNQLKEISNRIETASSFSLSRQALRHEATMMQCTPSSMGMLMMNPEAIDALQPLRKLLLGGEALPPLLASEVKEKLQGRVFNMYGPTETTVWSACHEVTNTAGNSIPVGRPIANTRIYILDQHLQPSPVGAAGELYIGGDGLAAGYLNGPELTAEKFVPHPFSRRAGERVYRTGDLARFLPDGAIEFLGRADHQVKLRGFRIELAEIELVLAQHPAVKESIVVAVKTPAGEQQLAAYIVLAGDGEEATVGALRGYLQQRLPEYMTPSVFVILESLPLTNNGKVDRRALPPPDQARLSVERTVALPRDNLEIQLAQIWRDVLGVEGEIGITENFFELGGHSIRAVRLMSQILKWFGQKLPLSTLFRGATIEQLAEVLRGQAVVEAPSPLVPIQPQGMKRPFFCVHTGSGEVLSYESWARHLGVNQPFYGLQDHMAYREEEEDLSLEEIAARYLSAIKTVQEEGPYQLGGWSFGGLVAFEMAQQLKREGQEVGLLLLVDAPSPAFAQKVVDTDDATLLTILANQLTRSTMSHEEMRMLVEDLRRLNSEEQLQHLLQYFVETRSGDGYDAEYALEFLRRQLRVFRSRENVSHRYEPRFYHGRITLFRPSEEPEELKRLDPTKGWGELSSAPVDIHRVPGNHQTMGLEPNVSGLAEKLRERLEHSQTTAPEKVFGRGSLEV